MLDNSVKINTNMNIPATGIIQKSSAKSFFIICHQTSSMADNIFISNPKLNGEYITILQIMLINDGYVLVEAIYNPNL